MTTCEITSSREIDSAENDMNTSQEEIKVAPAEMTSIEDTSGQRQSDAQQLRSNILLGRSGTETDMRPPPRHVDIGGITDEINDEDVLLLKEDTAMNLPVVPEGNPYDRAMKYLHKHSLPSLFQYITINLAYQRPENAIDFMIDEVRKRSQGQPEEPKMFG